MRKPLAAAAVVIGSATLWALALTLTRPPHSAAVPAANRAAQLRAEPLPAPFEGLRPLAVAKQPPEPGDWLAEHEEQGQSLAEHRVECQGVAGQTVYLLAAGDLSPASLQVLDALEPLLAAHFQLPVRRLAPLDASLAGRSARQRDVGTQWLTGDILDALRTVRPSDAAAVMAVAQVDLYPDPSWNFVFGEATWEDRVAVMSLARTGDLAQERALVLERTFATAAHEVGHMLQLAHCIAWECPMNGSNHQAEADSRPLEPCPHCLAKLAFATGLDPQARWAAMRAAYADAGILRGVEEIDRSLAALDAGAH